MGQMIKTTSSAGISGGTMENDRELTAQLEFSKEGTLVGILLNVKTDEQEKAIISGLAKLMDPAVLVRVCTVYDR